MFKTSQLFTASHLIAMVLTTVLSIGFASCSKEEDIEDVSQLSGTWKHEYTDENGYSLVDAIWFNPEMSYGEYRPAVGWKGSFWYSIKTPGIIHLKITYYRYDFIGQRLSYKDEVDWSCHKKGDRLWIDNKDYRKVSNGMDF